MTEITLNLTLEELKQIDKYVELNDETRPLFDKIWNAYPKPETLLDVIRNLGYSVDMCYEIVDAVEEFEKSKELEEETKREIIKRNLKTSLQELVNDDVRPIDDVVREIKNQQVKELVRESVKWCEEHPDENPLDWVKPQPTDDKNFKNSLDLIKEWGEKNKPPNLKELLWEWWEDIFTRNSDLDADASIDYLVDIIDKKFIPPSSDRNGYEWEKCLKMMRDKLR